MSTSINPNHHRIVGKIRESQNIGIIGSSPLLLMVAIYLAKKGKKVTVIDKCSSLGGCWKLISEGNVYTEDSCHLLESYAESYKFITLKMQIPLIHFATNNYPIKVLKHKELRIEKYHRKASILNETIIKLLSVIKNIAKTIASILSMNISRTDNSLSRLMRSIKDISFFLRYRLKQVLCLQELLIHPRGWGGFTEDLINKVKENKNISILNNQIVQINNGTDLCSLVTEDNNLIDFDITISGESLTLGDNTLKTKKLYNDEKISFDSYYHYLFSFEASENVEVTKIPQYIHFVNHNEAHRLTLVGELSPIRPNNVKLLLQTRCHFNKEEITVFAHRLLTNLSPLFSKNYNEKYRDLPIGKLKLLREIYTNIPSHNNDNITNREGWSNSLLILRTFGDLSKNILYNNKYMDWIH